MEDHQDESARVWKKALTTRAIQPTLPYSSCKQFLMESLRCAPQKQMPRLLAAAA